MNMRQFGFALMVLGSTALAFESYAYWTAEPVANAEPKYTGADANGPIPVLPIVGIAGLGAGVWCLSHTKVADPHNRPHPRSA